jgi:hypothetical protein
VETVVRIQMRGVSSTGGPVTISASLVGSDAESLRVDYGVPVTRSTINTPKGVFELRSGKPTVWKPPHVGAFAQRDILSALAVLPLIPPNVVRTPGGNGSVNGRASQRIHAATGRAKTVFRRAVTDEVDIQIDEETRLVAEILRRHYAEGSLDVTFQAGFRFADYRLVTGIYLPFRIERVMGGAVRETIVLDAIELNPPLSTGFFEPPASRQSPAWRRP